MRLKHSYFTLFKKYITYIRYEKGLTFTRVQTIKSYRFERGRVASAVAVSACPR